VIELSQKMQTLTAYGQEACTECVHTTFLGEAALGQAAESAQPGKPKAARAGSLAEESKQSRAVDLSCSEREAAVSDAERKATFSQHVEAVSSSVMFLRTRQRFSLRCGPRFQSNRVVASSENGNMLLP